MWNDWRKAVGNVDLNRWRWSEIGLIVLLAVVCLPVPGNADDILRSFVSFQWIYHRFTCDSTCQNFTSIPSLTHLQPCEQWTVYCNEKFHVVPPIRPFLVLPHILERALLMRDNYLSSFELVDFRRANNHRGCGASCHGDPLLHLLTSCLRQGAWWIAHQRFLFLRLSPRQPGLYSNGCVGD